MSDYLIIRTPDPEDDLPEHVAGWLALNAQPLQHIGFYHGAGMHVSHEKWDPDLPAAFAIAEDRLPGPKTNGLKAAPDPTTLPACVHCGRVIVPRADQWGDYWIHFHTNKLECEE